MSEPVQDKRKYFLMKAKYGPCRCGKNVTGRYFQFPLGYKKQVLQPGCFFFFFFLQFPLVLFAMFPWGAGSPSALRFSRCRLRSKPGLMSVRGCAMCKGRRKSVTRWLILLLIWNFWYCTSSSDNTIPYTWAYFFPKPTSLILLTWTHAEIRGNRDFMLLFFLFLLLSCLVVGGISLPPFLFLLQCRKKLFTREIKENISSKRACLAWMPCFEKCPIGKRNEVKSWTGVNYFYIQIGQ